MSDKIVEFPQRPRLDPELAQLAIVGGNEPDYKNSKMRKAMQPIIDTVSPDLKAAIDVMVLSYDDTLFAYEKLQLLRKKFWRVVTQRLPDGRGGKMTFGAYRENRDIALNYFVRRRLMRQVEAIETWRHAVAKNPEGLNGVNWQSVAKTLRPRFHWGLPSL